MGYSIRTKRGESIVYTILWMVILLMPIYISKSTSGIDWLRVQREWIRLLPFAVIFAVHNYLLFPLLFLKNKRVLYFTITFSLVILISILANYIGELFYFHPENMGPGPIQGPPQGMQQGPPRGQQPPGRNLWDKVFIDNIVVSVLVIGFNAAIKLTVKWQDQERKSKELEKQKLQTELAFLKNQISPHFFMNTLNNIHALIDINSDDAKESIIKLSKLMRYLLYDSEEGKTTLSQEIEFIKNYVDLMKLRFTEKVKIRLSFPENIPDVRIPPMLFTSLLENAFKHGISYRSESFIEMVMKTDDKRIYFRIINSKNQNDNRMNEPGGIGLENLKKRLDLIYQNRYFLEKKENDNTFEIYIKLPLNG